MFSTLLKRCVCTRTSTKNLCVSTEASSSEMFGKVQAVPQSEETLLWPRSPYGVAKTFGHYMTINYRESYGMHASSGILFNHESPRRGPEFVTRKITQAVARISLGLQDTLSLGNLDARRALGFCGRRRRSNVAHAPAARSRRLCHCDRRNPRDPRISDHRIRSCRHFHWEKYVKQDPRFMRPAEVDLLIGDASKARNTLGWKPTVTFEQLVAMMVESDLEQASIGQ